ncbi:putative glycoside hydrolase [Golovinomyces cichoracearum]|uniref:Putative glycoside hydrolase n=1 Tax=Golovinomyces cichoracearum TaxID=62708 RepID=A0A420IXP2_9PEZI|nr:putative glycoside hydrolase [Golovinomyces cichoracearum]
MTTNLPIEALGVSVCVFIYSVGCLILSTLLVCLLIAYGERSKYVTLVSTFTALSTFASIVQQVHFVANWSIIRKAHFEEAMQKLLRHGVAFGGAGETWDVVLFNIQFYCYNVMTLNILFWAISLFNSSWACTFTQLGGRHHNLALSSKFFSILWPGFVISILQFEALHQMPTLHIIATYATIFVSLTFGSILLVLILFKYIKTRRLVAECYMDDDWWGPSENELLTDRDSKIENYGKVSSKLWSRKRSIYDRALITRFTIGFVIMAVFEVVIVFLTLHRIKSNAIMVKSGEPDLSVSNAIVESLLFLPGVSASLMAFLVFGTTKPWSNYRDLMLGDCSGGRRKMSKRMQYNSSFDDGRFAQPSGSFSKIMSWQS